MMVTVTLLMLERRVQDPAGETLSNMLATVILGSRCKGDFILAVPVFS